MSIPPYPFYFLRHGETDWNATNRIMGQKDIPLNEKGIEQSRDVKVYLKNYRLEKIWSSPLQRARQTAEIINETFQYPIEFIDYLKERNWGKGEGLSHDHFLPDMKPNFRMRESAREQIPEGAEPYSDFEVRVILAFQKVLSATDNPPLVVGHGGVFLVLTRLLTGASLSAENCVLHFFKPPESLGHPWGVVNLAEKPLS